MLEWSLKRSLFKLLGQGTGCKCFALRAFTILIYSIIERHAPQPQRQIRLEMQRRDHLAQGQACKIGVRMRKQAERRRAGLSLFQGDVFKGGSSQARATTLAAAIDSIVIARLDRATQ
jgi:hypothetical protein